MPNGISCAYFAGKNLIYGQKEKNVFKQGIAGIQATRTLDSAANAGMVKVPNIKILDGFTNIVKKLLYPLIILSGVYNTAKSDDKVKTGMEQFGGISTMYLFEQLAEKGLNAAEKKLTNLDAVKNNKKLAAGVYILKGLCFVGASLAGYNTGSKISQKAVDKIRDAKQNSVQNTIIPDNENIIEEDAVLVDNQNEEEELNNNIFEEMPF